MAKYAEGTKVNSFASIEEIQRLLRARGCVEFGQMTSQNTAAVVFRYEGVPYRMQLNLPDPDDDKFTCTPSGRWSRSEKQANDAYEQEVKRLWRAILLVMKAKLVAVDEGVVTFHNEFLSYAVLGDGRSVGQHCKPLLERAKDGEALPLTLALPGGN
jgi:hypothetical protein